MTFKLFVAVLALSLTGCALSAGFRFGDDGSVSKPVIHGSVGASGTVKG